MVPHLQRTHLTEFGHVLAIGADASEHRLAGACFAQPVVARRDYKAGRQTLEVPLPGSRERLVQVVDIEDGPAFGRGENAEVAEMGVATRLHAHAGGRQARQVHGHGQGRPAVIRERRCHHAPMTKRNQLGDAPLVALLHQLHGIGATGRRLPNGMCAVRAGFPQVFAAGDKFRSRRAHPGPRACLGVGLRFRILGRLFELGHGDVSFLHGWRSPLAGGKVDHIPVEVGRVELKTIRGCNFLRLDRRYFRPKAQKVTASKEYAVVFRL